MIPQSCLNDRAQHVFIKKNDLRINLKTPFWSSVIWLVTTKLWIGNNQKGSQNNIRPRCSKLTTSLVNVSLKFQTLISQISWYFLLKKCVKLLQKLLSFFRQKISLYFAYKVVKHLTSWPLNELVKLTMLWTTGPRTPTCLELWKDI